MTTTTLSVGGKGETFVLNLPPNVLLWRIPEDIRADDIIQLTFDNGKRIDLRVMYVSKES